MSPISYCGGCKYWNPQMKDGKILEIGSGPTPGECHKGPPAVTCLLTPKGTIIQTQFPLPHSQMWCGEYVPRMTQ